jgi:hypothetical protein
MARHPDRATPDIIERDFDAQERGERRNRLSTYPCPDYGGALWQFDDDDFGCHTGHRYAPDTLLVRETEALEAALFTAVRLLKEKATLLRQVAAKAASASESAARLREQAAMDDDSDTLAPGRRAPSVGKTTSLKSPKRCCTRCGGRRMTSTANRRCSARTRQSRT